MTLVKDDVQEQILAAAEARFCRYGFGKTTMAEIARDCDMSLVTFAIAWTLTKEFVGSTLLGATSPEQLDPALAAAELRLPDDAIAAQERIAKEIRYPMG